jgi:hypothetical protein
MKHANQTIAAMPYITMESLFVMMPLVVLLAIPSPVRADQYPVKDGKKQEPLDVRTLLEKGRASGSLPEGMVIRIGACLGASDVKASGDRVPEELKETWEFTSNQVHRVVFEYKKDKSTYNRVESRPFDSKGICKDLLEGKAIEIQARKGEGPEVAFVGTSYHLGSRFIAVVWKGETILDLHETNGAFLDLYRESDARAFGALYERLASELRAAFRIIWGDVVNGLQLGISPPAGTNGVAAAVFDGKTLHINVQVRNTGKTPVRFLASTFGCATVGPHAAIPVTKLILTPSNGGEPLSITYQGVNHVSDKRQLDAKDVEYYTTELAPGQALKYSYPVEFTPGEDRATSWQRTGESNLVPEGKYQLKAVFVVDRPGSKWKGELTSGSLEVDIRPSDKKGEASLAPPEVKSAGTAGLVRQSQRVR